MIERVQDVLVVAMMPAAGCPVVIGNGTYQHAELLASHLAPLLAVLLAEAKREEAAK